MFCLGFACGCQIIGKFPAPAVWALYLGFRKRAGVSIQRTHLTPDTIECVPEWSLCLPTACDARAAAFQFGGTGENLHPVAHPYQGLVSSQSTPHTGHSLSVFILLCRCLLHVLLLWCCVSILHVSPSALTWTRTSLCSEQASSDTRSERI